MSNPQKKLLVIANYFYPDYASTGQLLTELCEYLSNYYDVTVIATIPSYTENNKADIYQGKRFYDEVYKNIRIIRVSVPILDKSNKLSRIKHILVYFINAFIAIFKSEKPDIIFTISQPPILGGLLGVLGKVFRRTKLVYNIQDFNPEQAEAINYNKSKYINGIARWVDIKSCYIADAVIVVGRDMLERLHSRCKNIDRNKTHVINNWIDEEKVYPLSKKDPNVQRFIYDNNLDDSFVIMYSGNIGLYYDLENIIKVIEDFKENDEVKFVFIGSGAQKDNLIKYCTMQNIKNVIFLPYQPKEKIINSLNAADVHLVTNQKGIKGISVPSKIYGVMATGKPILGILEKGSEAYQLIKNCNNGLIVEPQKYDEIRQAINWFIKNKNTIGAMGINGRKYLEENLKMADSFKKYKKVLDQL